VAPASIGYAQMSALLREPRNDDKDRDRASRTTVLYIDDAPYTNSAAKFWPTLIDELLEEYPSATAFELTAPAPSVLTPRCLDPAAALEESLERLKNVDIRAAMASTLAELELLGGPAPVIMRVLAGDEELLRRDLPAECVDAEILPYLVAWILRWAGIADARWNEEFLSGALRAEDRRRGRTYAIDFGLHRQHIGEGLHQWSLTVMPMVETILRRAVARG